MLTGRIGKREPHFRESVSCSFFCVGSFNELQYVRVGKFVEEFVFYGFHVLDDCLCLFSSCRLLVASSFSCEFVAQRENISPFKIQ